ncbi:hypothetical protein [Rhodococcus sp. YH1]|uniref:hypothetical protein n=1 Tax=Rhodococcus sp. YH1 TaxID=89066 RepID=UPI0013870FF5|nr:hypothetical protein [Rhodococcus sp. YH1]NCL78714.1 hypothetical protein [Rhodococcus sp. YH1]
MSTSTSTNTYTRAHTATHLSDVILSSIADILATLGIEASRLYQSWDQDAAAIAAWITEGSLASVSVECHHSGTVDPIFEFPVSYTAKGFGDRGFTADNASMLRYLAKLKAVPAGTTFKLFCAFNGPRTPQPGWSPGSSASTANLRSRTIGTLATAPDATASARVYMS